MPASYSPAEARAAEAAHVARAERYTLPHLERRTRGTSHPVWDFLFDYYPFRASQLTRWHPGLGATLIDASLSRHKDYPFYVIDADGAVRLDVDAFLAKRGRDMERIQELLSATATRQAHFDCFGMHEWAMVYRTDAPRHNLPLRLGREGTDAVVDKHQLKCSHFDAYRFFTPPAVPLNLTVLERGTQAEHDQAGCVHVSMDLYKWAAKMGPVVPGELLLDAFELAMQARVLDMEASPYDCRSLGFGVVAVETPEGKAEYVARQRALAAEAEPIRARLLALLEELLAH
ncbi:3-methyladenine DNA glycosylase [Corynebacterium sp. CNCTC7651]|uniref:3-methyladenine DNA glycosylase n=1 Tax=Corynebacterium sp. CNCTC7651 TaxID=2815361 RepID=UPI001F3BE1DD|nr:3-methyladenine DNA glycosylase [Corynebacterium sp. CNCTC7651]UIZ93122.1 3-methyladenine DNA glycosylase [Corynebacterium sp. CNCTC7651]